MMNKHGCKWFLTVLCGLSGWLLVSCGPGPDSTKMAETRLLAGPMPGWSGHRGVEVWAMVEGPGRPDLVCHPAGDSTPGAKVRVKASAETGEDGKTILRYHPALLEPGRRYAYTLDLPAAPDGLEFQTQADWPYKTDAPDFTFILGSCLYLNDTPYDRPGKPYGQGGGILGLMAESRADFMLWLGDNTYLRPADWTSPAGIRYRFARERADPSMQPLLRAMHHFATWDDHDFGPNDSSKSFPLRESSTREFRNFWANPPSGLPASDGIMSTFVWSDCLFVLLDNRSNRDANDLDPAPHPGKTMLGERQLDWLEQTLLEHRETPFKFIVQGGQILKDHDYESYADFPGDRKRILDFIKRQRVEGVVFLSGDRHFTELNRLVRKEAYPLYELTSSPIGSGVAAGALKKETVNPMRVEGTLVDTQNFCRITVRGGRGVRVLTMESVDKDGVRRWQVEIAAADLRH